MITYNKQRFIALLEKQMASILGLSASEGISDIEFQNNTIVIKMANKAAIANRRQTRSDIVTAPRRRHDRG